MPPPQLQLRFGKGGNASQYLLNGWSFEEDGYIWAVGPEARLILPWPAGLATLCLDISLRPMVHPPAVLAQRLDVTVNGVSLGQAVVTEAVTLAFIVPAALLAAELAVTLRQPDAASPASIGANPDRRALGFAVAGLAVHPAPGPGQRVIRPPIPPPGLSGAEAARGLTGLAPGPLAACFEPLGQNCEFGRAQQALGGDRISLLRFAGIRQVGLLHGLADGFAQLEDAGQCQLGTYRLGQHQRFCLRHDGYAAEFYSPLVPGTVSEKHAIAAIRRNLAFRRRLFLDALAQGGRLFVVNADQVGDDAAALPILHALRRHGDNALLYVAGGAPGIGGATGIGGAPLAAGTVERRFDGLYCGWRAPPITVEPPDAALWLSLCANAYRLWREDGRGG